MKLFSCLRIICSVAFVFTNAVSLIWIFPDPEYNSGNGTYLEMKAEVTEVPASRFMPDGNRNLTGKIWVVLKLV